MSKTEIFDQFDWYTREIEKLRPDVAAKRQAFLDADIKLQGLERERDAVWKRMAIAPQDGKQG